MQEVFNTPELVRVRPGDHQHEIDLLKYKATFSFLLCMRKARGRWWWQCWWWWWWWGLIDISILIAFENEELGVPTLLQHARAASTGVGENTPGV